MATEVISPSEIILNSVRYPVIGKVKRQLTSIFPEKQVIGDYTVLSDANKSAWVISDQRGGIMIEEMDEKKDANRCYWSTCNLGFKGHIILPKLATAATDDTPTHTASGWNLPTDYGDPTGAWTDETKAYDEATDTWAYDAVGGNNTYSEFLELSIPSISCSHIRYYASIASSATMTVDLDAYYNGTWNDVFEGTATRNTLESKSLAATSIVTGARIRIKSADSGTGEARVKTFDFYGTATAFQGAVQEWITFNSNWYLAWGNLLLKLDTAAGASYVTVKTFPIPISALIADGSNLFVFQADEGQYWYATPTTSSATLAADLDVSETGVDVSDGTQFVAGDIITIDSEEMQVSSIAANTLTVVRGFGSTAATHTSGVAITTMRFVQTTASPHGINATKGIYWDSKLYKIDSAGSMHLLTDPATTTPVEVDKGDLPIDDDDIQRLYDYYNIDGDDVIYASTKKGVFVHDEANAKWLQSELQIPEHANAGKGVCVWRDGSFISAGLDVIKYVPAVPAQIISMGLDRDDGLPVEYAGEIMYMTSGYNEMYAAVDASQVSGTGYSTIMAYDGNSWQCKWFDTTADQAISALGVSSVHSYNLWFNAGTTIYKIPLHRNLRNPLKISTDTYATSAMHLTPWFDADWQVGNKLALSLDVFAGGDVSAAETITVKYRLDHANTDRDTFGSVVKTIITSGLNTYTFGSSLGSAFKAIQFRFDLIRAAGSTTETPDILYCVLYYKKVLPKKWGYRATLDLSRPYHGVPSKTLLSNLETAAELGTLMTFVYRGTTKYVEVRSVEGEEETGSVNKGQFNVFVTEL